MTTGVEPSRAGGEEAEASEDVCVKSGADAECDVADSGAEDEAVSAGAMEPVVFPAGTSAGADTSAESPARCAGGCDTNIQQVLKRGPFLSS